MKTTKKHFEYFVKECKKAIKLLGISGWDITYFHGGNQLKGAMAETSTTLETKVAGIYLSKDWPYSTVSYADLKFTAYHEACHLIMARLHCLARCRYVSESEIKEADEEAVNTLTYTLRRLNVFV